jgi:hypothetical protein
MHRDQLAGDELRDPGEREHRERHALERGEARADRGHARHEAERDQPEQRRGHLAAAGPEFFAGTLGGQGAAQNGQFSEARGAFANMGAEKDRSHLRQ